MFNGLSCVLVVATFKEKMSVKREREKLGPFLFLGFSISSFSTLHGKINSQPGPEERSSRPGG